MLIIWALYVVAISTLLVAAAWGVERVLRSRGKTTRFVWAAAFTGSFLSPLLGGLFVAVRDVAASRGVGLARALAPASAVELHPVAEFLDRAAVAGVGADVLFLAGWILATGGALTWLWVSKLSLGRMSAAWKPSSWRGEPVLLTDDIGPSVVGFLRPQLVIPEWVKELSEEQQELVLEHELEHLRVWDPRFSQLFLGLVCLVPWNLPLVAAYRRLRLAIEVDCDRRVVTRKGSRRTYGRTLLEAHSRVPAQALGFLRRSELEQRIRCLVGSDSRWVRIHDGLAVLATVAAVVAFVVLPLPRRTVFGVQTVMGPATPHPVTHDTSPRLLSDDLLAEGVFELQRLARRLDLPEGRVTFYLRIGTDGDVERVVLAGSSGDPRVDAAARRIATRTRWEPALEDGSPKSVWVYFRELAWATGAPRSPRPPDLTPSASPTP
jgi:TonB family protein